MAANPPGFHYGRGGLAAIREGHASQAIASKLEDGFVLARSALEIDFDTVSAEFFRRSGPGSAPWVVDAA